MLRLVDLQSCTDAFEQHRSAGPGRIAPALDGGSLAADAQAHGPTIGVAAEREGVENTGGVGQPERTPSPGNAVELLGVIDAAEATPDDRAVQVQLATIEAACTTVPVYAGLLAARQRYLGTLPWVAARHALRGWEGVGLPPFQRLRGLVPDELLDALPQDDVEAVGWRASTLMQPGRDAEGNSGAPSLSPETPAPMTAG